MTKDELIEIACEAFHDTGSDLAGFLRWVDLDEISRDKYREGMRGALEAMAKATETERRERQVAAQQTADCPQPRYWNPEGLHQYLL